MLSRLLISLAQLKAGNNSEELKKEIRQLLYSLYRSKKLTTTICNNLEKRSNLKKKILMKDENSKTNTLHRFRLTLADKLKELNTNMELANLIFITHGKILNLEKYLILKFLLHGSYSISYIQDNFCLLLKKHETTANNPPKQIYVNKIRKQDYFKNKDRL